MRRGAVRALGLLVGIGVALYLAAAGYLYAFQRDYVFKPSGELGTPAEHGLPEAQPVVILAADGTPLAGWYQPPAPGQPTVLYFHGNAGNIAERAPRLVQIAASGYGFLAMSYRGFPGSGGKPSEKALVADGIALFDWLAERSDAIIIHGESLGTGVAVEVAAAREAKALILEAPYTAALDIAAETYPWIPTSLLMRDPFLSRVHIRDVAEPLLVVHGTADKVVPFAMGEALFALANSPKQMVVKEGAGHSELWRDGLWADVLDFLGRNAILRS